MVSKQSHLPFQSTWPIANQITIIFPRLVLGNAMFQLNMNNNRQHQTLALNSLIMNNIFNLANCFNQFGEFNVRSGFKSHPFFVCVLLLAVFLQVCLTELNAFGLENLNPIQWFVCFVFAALSALISPLTGQQQRSRGKIVGEEIHKSQSNHNLDQGFNYRLESPTKSPHKMDSSGSKSSMPKARTTKQTTPKGRKSQAGINGN